MTRKILAHVNRYKEEEKRLSLKRNYIYQNENRDVSENRAVLGAMRQHRLRLLNKSVLSPGVRDTDGKGEGKWES